MINLLPPEYATLIRYGRRNAVLRKWLIGAALAIVGLVIIILSGWAYFNHQSSSLKAHIDASHGQLKAQNLAQVQKDADEISGDIKVINQVLSREIDFAGLMQKMGTVMPPGSILGSVTLSKVDGAMDLTVNAKDHVTAVQAAVNLGDPANNIYTRVDVVNINCTSQDTLYKCNATLKALFGKGTQNKFLNVPGKDKS
jgi:hypothetical protein